MRVLVEELSSEQIESIEKRMRPKEMSESGFLADADSLIDIIARDGEKLKQLGISHQQIADRLESIISQAYRIVELARRGKLHTDCEEEEVMEHIGPSMPVEGKFTVNWRSYNGWQDCPFEDSKGDPCSDSSYATTDYTIKNTDKQANLNFPGLIIHLIRDHHFFEGSVPYRVDPARVIEVLELEPGRDYSPKLGTEFVWRREREWAESMEKLEAKNKKEYQRLKDIIDNPEEKIDLTDQVRLYFRGEICVSVAQEYHALRKPLYVGEAYWEHDGVRKGVESWRRVEYSHVIAQGYETPQNRPAVSPGQDKEAQCGSFGSL